MILSIVKLRLAVATLCVLGLSQIALAAEPVSRKSNQSLPLISRDYVVIEFDHPPFEHSLHGETRELKDAILTARMMARRERENSPERQKQLAKDKQIALAQRKEMASKGFIVRPGSDFSALYYFLAKTPDQKSPYDVEPAIGFVSWPLSAGLDVKGIYGEPSEDGRYYDIVTVVENEALGTVVIGETKTGGEYGIRRIRSPRLDTSINGNPALFSVYRSEDGDLGQSNLVILTSEKVIGIDIFFALEEGTPMYDAFFEFAHQAY